MRQVHISLSAEVIAHIGPLPITNTLMITWVIMAFLIFAAWLIRSRLALIPGKLQLMVEYLIEGLHSLFLDINGRKTKQFFPLLATLFIFILVANWTELLPGFGSIRLEQRSLSGEAVSIPLLRAPTADLNTTFALALIAVIYLQWQGVKSLGIKYICRFINLDSPVSFFVGLLEIVSEIAKIVSFAFRLFGNIFAGEVLLAIAALLMPLFVPLPFLGLELFVGVVQALVFSMLTAVFLNIAVAKH